ncbi:MAG: carboxypeptidase regulatory-like domain-containing protein [Solirubrobacteraceae bacterium]
MIACLTFASPAPAASPGSVSGTVMDAVTHAAVASACVTAYDVNNPLAVSTQTDSLGHYTLSGLAAGTYKVGFQACGAGNYQAQFYNNKPSLAAADPVLVAADGTTSGIDAALQPGGAITGTVTDGATGSAVAGECVSAVGTNNSPGAFATTDTFGHYTLSGLAAGNYTVGFQACGGGNYVTQYYNNKPSATGADLVTVTAGSTTSGVDAALRPGGQITGTVTDAVTGSPVANECVGAFAGTSVVGSATTDASGHYAVMGLAAGSYTIGFQTCGGGNYLPQYYNNKPSPATADPVTVTAGATTSGVDAALQPAGQISGTVTNAVTGAPVANECVSASSTNNGSGFATTDALGHYTLSRLAAGSYTVGFQTCGGGNYLPQYYNGKPSPATADPVTVTAGSTTSGIDAALQPGGRITGTVTDAVTGSPVANECVSASGQNSSAGALTDASGHYTLTGLGTGDYTVRFTSCGGTGNYAPQYYDDKPSAATADLVAVAAGNTTSGIDAALQAPGQITGTVTDAVTHAPISGACVGVFDTTDQAVTSTQTDSAGHYTLSPLATGSYKVGFASGGSLCPNGPRDYRPELYDARTSFATADIVAVTAGATTSGIDAALQPAGDTPPNTPSAPTSNQAVNNDGNQTLSWAAVTDPDGDSIDHYVVQHERSDQTAFTDVATLSGTSYRFGTDGPSENEGTWTYRVIAVDSQGTSSAPSDPSVAVVVDKTKPSPPSGHTAPGPAHVDSATGTRWYKDSVTVSFSANGDPALGDGSPGSGVASVTPAKTFDSANVDPKTGAFSQDGTATDNAGNVSAAATVAGSVDWAAPTASFSDCPRSDVLLHSAHAAVWTASDPAPSSGLATSARGSVALDTSRVGPHTVRSPAPADNVGHVGSAASCTYTVDYVFSGFADPVKSPPGVNTALAGSTVPVKWQLTDAHGKYISALSAVTSITYKATSCGAFTTDPAGGSNAVSAGGTGVRYDPARHQYIFNWTTPGPGCYSLFLTLDSGRVQPAYFSVTGTCRAVSFSGACGSRRP